MMDEDKENRNPDILTATIDNLSRDSPEALDPLEGGLNDLRIAESSVFSPRRTPTSSVINDSLPALDFGAINNIDSFGGPLWPNQQSDNSPIQLFQDDFEFLLQSQAANISEHNAVGSNPEALHENNEQYWSENAASGNPPRRTNLHREPLDELAIGIFRGGHYTAVTPRSELVDRLYATSDSTFIHDDSTPQHSQRNRPPFPARVDMDQSQNRDSQAQGYLNEAQTGGQATKRRLEESMEESPLIARTKEVLADSADSEQANDTKSLRKRQRLDVEEVVDAAMRDVSGEEMAVFCEEIDYLNER